jgi:hypothetical protein
LGGLIYCLPLLLLVFVSSPAIIVLRSLVGIQHCIWDIQQSSFDAMSLAFSTALFKALKGETDEDTNSAWFNFLTTVSSLISDRYERYARVAVGEYLLAFSFFFFFFFFFACCSLVLTLRVRTGYRGEIFHRHGSEWRKKGFLLTHEALMLYKSPEGTWWAC